VTSKATTGRYYISFIDDAMLHATIYLMRHKSEVFDCFKKYEAYLITYFDTPIRCLHSDRGGEYTFPEFVSYLQDVDTEQKLTVANIPEHNSVAELFNRQVLERVRATLHAAQLPPSMWSEAMRHAIYLINRTPTSVLKGCSPYEVVFHSKPDLSDILEFSHVCFVHTPGLSKVAAGHATEAR
jgi:hypothetical protein